MECPLLFCIDLGANLLMNSYDIFTDFENKTFKEFLDSRKLSKTIKHFVQYSIAMTTKSTPTLEVCMYVCV